MFIDSQVIGETGELEERQMRTGKRGYEVDDLYRLKAVSDPQMSPDGEQVAYVVTEIDREEDRSRSSVWVVASSGGEPRRLTEAGCSAMQPRWSPDGQTIAYLAVRDGDKRQLARMPARGGEARILTDLPAGVQEHVWSPDGRLLALLARTGGVSGQEQAPPPIVISSFKHKFNGQGFFDGSRVHIFVIDGAGGEPRQLTDGDWDDSQPTWSPDGQRIAFVSARHAERDRNLGSDLWQVGISGGEARALTQTEGPCGSPAFSPDGRMLAFSGHQDPAALGERNNHIWLMPAGGGPARDLTGAASAVQAGAALPGTPASPLLWTPDSCALLARIQVGAEVTLNRFSIAGGRHSLLVDGRRCVEAVSQSRAGRLALLISDLTHPAEVFVADADGSNERRVTSTNDALLHELQLPEITPLAVRTSQGTMIEGWVIKPPDLTPGARCPLVLDVHGGPHGAFLNSFRGSYALALPTQGCAVLQMNPTGSTGWGEDFARALHGGRGERDLPELLDALDQLIREGWVDPTRLGITGYSYGGYMTAWAISQTDRFMAAVWGAGTANLYTHFAYSDITLPRFHEMQGSPWDQRELYLRQSPISYVERVRTPLLMLHGDADLRCNIAQADEFFTALKYYGNEVVLVRYPGQDHMMRMRGRPSYRIDYDRRLIAWFQHFLGFNVGQGAGHTVSSRA